MSGGAQGAVAHADIEAGEALVLGEFERDFSLLDLLSGRSEFGAPGERGFHRLVEIDGLHPGIRGIVGGLELQGGICLEPVAEHRRDQAVLGVTVLVAGEDQVEFTVRHPGLGLDHLHLGDHPDLILDLGLLVEGLVALEALLGDPHLLLVGHQDPIIADDRQHDVHDGSSEVVDLRLVAESAELHLGPGLVPDEPPQEGRGDAQGQARLVFRAQAFERKVGVRTAGVEVHGEHPAPIRHQGRDRGGPVQLVAFGRGVGNQRVLLGLLPVDDLAFEERVVGTPCRFALVLGDIGRIAIHFDPEIVLNAERYGLGEIQRAGMNRCIRCKRRSRDGLRRGLPLNWSGDPSEGQCRREDRCDTTVHEFLRPGLYPKPLSVAGEVHLTVGIFQPSALR